MSIINESKIDTKEIYNLQFNKFFNSYLNKNLKLKIYQKQN